MNNSQLLETESKKIIIYDPKADDIVQYVSSLTFGITIEIANLFFNKSNRLDIEQTKTLAGARFKSLANLKLQQDYFGRMTRLLNYSKLLLSQRDTQVLFAAVKRIVRVCLERASFKEHKTQADSKTPEFDLEQLPSEADADNLDEEMLAGIHEGGLTDPHFAKLTDANNDYSQALHSITDKRALFTIIDAIFEALSFVESGGLQLPAIFVMPESQQLVVFQTFVMSLMFWGSNLPLSAFARATSSPFGVLLPIRLALVDLFD